MNMDWLTTDWLLHQAWELLKVLVYVIAFYIVFAIVFILNERREDKLTAKIDKRLDRQLDEKLINWKLDKLTERIELLENPPKTMRETAKRWTEDNGWQTYGNYTES